MRAFLKHFWISLSLTVLICILTTYYLGPVSAIPLVVLIAIEIVFSFDNAIINAKVLERLSPFWQNMFLTVGIVIAIFGMRLLFPIVIVAVAASLPMKEVWDLALNHPHEYAEKLEIAHPLISAYGGAFLLLLTLEFFINGKHQILWWNGLEKWLKKLSSLWLPTAITAAVILLLGWLNQDHSGQIWRAGFLGIATFIFVQVLTVVLGRSQPTGKHVVGWAAFSLFMYLQVLDASFSLDGVIGAFAITDVIILIAAGLGIGALWVRSMTVYMVRNGTLDQYRYLEHGAYYTIAVLAAALLLSLFVPIPEVITGVVGLGIIASAGVTSHRVRHLPVEKSH
jgi:hypothetical protein